VLHVLLLTGAQTDAQVNDTRLFKTALKTGHVGHGFLHRFLVAPVGHDHWTVHFRRQGAGLHVNLALLTMLTGSPGVGSRPHRFSKVDDDGSRLQSELLAGSQGMGFYLTANTHAL